MRKLANNKWKELTELFDQYVEVIVTDHHKSKDGKLSLEYHYDAFERKSWWILNHAGYNNDFWEEGKTVDEVIERGIATFKGLIEEEKSWRILEGIISSKDI